MAPTLPEQKREKSGDSQTPTFNEVMEEVNKKLSCFRPKQPRREKGLQNLRHEMIRRDGYKVYAVKWIGPMVFAMFGFYCQSVLLHYATYQYVQHMMQLTPEQRNSSLYATLEDPISDWLGGDPNANTAAMMGKLDMLAACFPALFFLLSVADLARRLYGIKVQDARTDNQHQPDRLVDYFGKNDAQNIFNWPVRTLQTWTKVMLCCGLMFMLKGTLGAVTTVPDSNGWATCRSRLKEDGFAWMNQTRSFSEMLTVDVYFNVVKGHSLRYCSDMMYSGHTFVVTLFALGVYENLRIIVSFNEVFNCWKLDRLQMMGIQLLVLTLFGLLAIFEQTLEIYNVLKTHFHYTSDVIMALVVTFLMYTNGAITLAAKNWELNTWGLQQLKWFQRNPESDQFDEKTAAPEVIVARLLATRGDILVPPCCIPFCWYSGREHFYNDEAIEDIANHIMKFHIANQVEAVVESGIPRQISRMDPDWYDNHEIIPESFNDAQFNVIRNELHLREGVSREDFYELMKRVSGAKDISNAPSTPVLPGSGQDKPPLTAPDTEEMAAPAPATAAAAPRAAEKTADDSDQRRVKSAPGGVSIRAREVEGLYERLLSEV